MIQAKSSSADQNFVTEFVNLKLSESILEILGHCSGRTFLLLALQAKRIPVYRGHQAQSSLSVSKPIAA